MAKFKAGDVVEIISGLNKGERGTVGSPNAGTENGKTLVSVYGDVKYIVPEDSLRLANAVRNAKFRVGDKVTDGSAIYAITDIDDGIYEWKVVSGKADPSYSEGGEVAWADAKFRLANAARNANFKVGDRVKVKNPPHHTSDEVGVIKKISGTGRPGDPVMAEVHYGEGATWGNNGVIYASPSIMRLANSLTPRSSNAVVRNALAARNAGIWGSAKEAEDRSDVFVRAALGRTKYNFDTEAGTLRDVIKLLASAEQTPKIKKNTEKLKGILSRVEKAAALFKGI